jgi:hypothetical protein
MIDQCHLIGKELMCNDPFVNCFPDRHDLRYAFFLGGIRIEVQGRIFKSLYVGMGLYLWVYKDL